MSASLIAWMRLLCYRMDSMTRDPQNASPPDSSAELRRGLLYGFSAYFVWGFFPVYFKAVAHIAPLEVVSHRIVWSLALLAVLIGLTGQWGVVRNALCHGRTLLTLFGSTLLIATNWLVFIFAVERGEVLQSSLGYFVTPLVNVLLGFIFLHERLRRWQMLSLALAVTGVAYLTWHHGSLPWISLVLATTFGLYGLLRKTVRVDSLVGLTVETLLLAPLALAYLAQLKLAGNGAFLAGSLRNDLLLPLAGLVTAIPLLWFAAAARRLRLATIGFLQYLTPTLHFLLAVWVYGEPFTHAHLISFLLIWSGLAIYSLAAVRGAQRSGGKQSN